MSAVRRFMTMPSNRPLVLKIDTSLGDGLPQFVLKTRQTIYNMTIQVSVNNGAFVLYNAVNEAIIPLPANTISTVVIRGSSGFSNMTFNISVLGNQQKLISVDQFGSYVLGLSNFRDCSNLVINATDTPRLSGTLNGTFWGIKGIDSSIINYWDFSKVGNIQYLFNEMQEELSGHVIINSNMLVIISHAFRGVIGKVSADFTFNTPNLKTAQQAFSGGFLENSKVIIRSNALEDIYFAFNGNSNTLDISEVDVSKVTNCTLFISNPLRTDIADNMLKYWDENLSTMVSGVDWHLRGTQVTSIGKSAIDSMEAKWGNTFSNYTVL